MEAERERERTMNRSRKQPHIHQYACVLYSVRCSLKAYMDQNTKLPPCKHGKKAISMRCVAVGLQCTHALLLTVSVRLTLLHGVNHKNWNRGFVLCCEYHQLSLLGPGTFFWCFSVKLQFQCFCDPQSTHPKTTISTHSSHFILIILYIRWTLGLAIWKNNTHQQGNTTNLEFLLIMFLASIAFLFPFSFKAAWRHDGLLIYLYIVVYVLPN